MIPALVVAAVMARADKLIAGQPGKDAREIAALDRQAENLYSELKPLGWKAAPALGAAASDHKRTVKGRLLATSFLAFTYDPAALAPLEDILLDREQEPVIRSLAAQSIPGQGAPKAAVSATLCSVLDEQGLPSDVARSALLTVSRLGCPEPAALVRLARSGDAPLVAPSIMALAHSRGQESARALIALVSYFPPRSEARAEAIRGLDTRREELATWHASAALPVVAEALRSETERFDTMLVLIRVIRTFGPENAAPVLAPLTKHPDAEILAETAESMAAYKRVETLPALEAAIKNAMTDPRFSPKEGRPDPAALLARIEKAVDALRRARRHD